MFVYIFFGLAFIFFFLSFLLVKMRMIYLVKNPEKYDHDYDGHKIFLIFIFRKLKYISIIFSIYVNLYYQKILHYRVQILAWLTSLSERVYMNSRDKFVKEVIRDKKTVPHFWSHLKKYKKEIDEENQNRIDDDSINTINK
ncbi:MAG: hypothetical protein KBD12_01235 [Candidatus Pacebacteria bacterium]|nr:hypothetical protein [Candidatus Paceibacterota bacterium]